MKKTDLFFGTNAFENAILVFLYLAGIFFLGIAIYAFLLILAG